MLIGIIILFLICQLPEVIVSLYQHAALKGGEDQLVKYLNVIKHTLAVINSSLNFTVYCKDILFRQCAKKICNKFVNCQLTRRVSEQVRHQTCQKCLGKILREY